MSDLESLLEKVRLTEEKGDLNGALTLLENASEELHDHGLFQFWLGSLLCQNGAYGKAISALSLAVELQPDIPEVKSNLAAAFLERAQAYGPEGIGKEEAQADLDHALKILLEATEENPRLPQVFSNLGRTLTLKGRSEEALEAFSNALALDAEHIPTLYNKAAALSMMKDWEKCLDALNEILRISPDFMPAIQSREHTLERMGR